MSDRMAVSLAVRTSAFVRRTVPNSATSRPEMSETIGFSSKFPIRPTADRRPAKSAAGQPAAQNLTIEDAREASPLPTVLKTAGLASVTVPQRPSEFDWKVADSTVVRSRPLKSGKLAVILAVSLAGK